MGALGVLNANTAQHGSTGGVSLVWNAKAEFSAMLLFIWIENTRLLIQISDSRTRSAEPQPRANEPWSHHATSPSIPARVMLCLSIA